jgi:adenosylcobinamide kinase/adenosylcobinamide-phosphate guanylyltransferase
MGAIILVTGGARSGKSAIAEGRTLSLGSPAIYIATAQAFDSEMEERIAAHQARRGEQWKTHAEPLDLCGALQLTDGLPRLVDCLTLWLTNLILAEREWRHEAEQLVKTLGAQAAPVVLVTNEVGAGIVPENRLARVFRDAAGTLNQQIAQVADEVILAVCGLPMKVK